MRKFLYYSLLCLLWVSLDSCKDEEVSAPAKPSFTVNQTTGLSGSTEFTFTVNQVSAQNISLLPYGTENASSGGVLIPASSFTNGVATVKFKYGRVGVFNAVVVSNNHTNDGTTVKNTVSDPVAITIKSNGNEISDFSLGVIRKADFNETVFTSLTTKTTIDKTAKTIDVVVRYALPKDGNNAAYITDLTKLVANFSSSAASTATVGGVAQTSGVTVTNFSAPVDYVVTANDGTVATYKVTVTRTDVETKTTLKSFSGVAGKKAAKERAMTGYVDNANKRVVIYDVYGTDPIQFDSMKVKYELDGAFAVLKQGGKTFDASKAIFDLTPAKKFVVFSQDSTTAGGTAEYDVYAVAAPKATLKIVSTTPEVTGTTEDFTIKLSVLTGTDLTSQNVTGSLTLPDGVTVSSITIGGVTTIPVGSDFAALGVNLSGSPKCELTVNVGASYSYKVVYSIAVTTLK